MAYERLNLDTGALLDKDVFKRIDDAIETLDGELFKPRVELFDTDTLIINKFIIPQTGYTGGASGYYCSDFIPIEPSRTINVNLGCKTGSNVGCAWYNANQKYISGFHINTSGLGKYVSPPEAYYMRVTNNPSYVAHEDAYIVMEAEEVLDNIKSLKAKLSEIEVYYEHEADTSSILPGLLSGVTGNPGMTTTTNAEYRYCPTYFSVTPGTSIWARAACSGSYAAIVYYDADQKFHSAIKQTAKDEREYTVPEGAYFVRLCSEYYLTTGITLRISPSKSLPAIADLQEQIENIGSGVGDTVLQPLFLPGRTESVINEDSGILKYMPGTPSLEIKYRGELNPEKRYLAIGFDDFRATDFSVIIPLFNKYNARATFNHIRSGTSINDTNKNRLNNVYRSGHEIGDHTWLHYKYPFDEPYFNGQDPSSPDGNQIPYPSNDQMRTDRGDGKNIFGRSITALASSTMTSGPAVTHTWGELTDDECQTIRNYFSVMKDDATKIINVLDHYSNLYLGTSGNSRGSWDDTLGCYTGGIFTGCKTSANHEIWERILAITNLYYKIGCGINYNVITWSLPGSKASQCWFEKDGKRYYDAECTVLVNNLAKIPSTLYKNPDGTPKTRSWTDVLYEYGYRITHDAQRPGRMDGQLTPAMRTQFIYNAFMSRKHALPFYTDSVISYATIMSEFTEDMFTDSKPIEVQMYDKDTTNSFRKMIEAIRLNTSNGMIQGEVIDSTDSYSERVFFESLLRYCVETGVEVINKAEAYDVCFNHKLRNGNLIYNPRLRNTAKEFMPTATTVPSNPDGYSGNCYVVKDSVGCPVLVTAGNTAYRHFGIPTGCNVTYSANVKGSGTIKIYKIRNKDLSNFNDSELIATLTASSTSDFTKLTSTMYIEDADLTDYEQRCMGYGEKVMGLKIVYSSGLEIKNISLTADC